MQLNGLDIALALLAVCALCAFLTLKGGLPASLSPLCALASLDLALTLGGVAGFLLPTAVALYLAAFGLGGWALWSEKRANKPVLARLLTPGMAVFWLLTLCFAVYLGLRQPTFMEYDEFTLWGAAAKMTSLGDRLYTELEIGWAWQGTQNPGLALLSYFVQFFGVFAPWKTYFAYDMLLFACFAAVLCGVRWRDYALAVPAALACWLSPFVFVVYVRAIYMCGQYLSSYGDIPAGIVFGGAVVFWLGLRQQRDGKPFWALLPVLALCANIKSNTFVLSLAAAGIAAVDLVLFSTERPWRKGLAQRLAKAAAFFAAPVATYLIWGRYVAILVQKNAESGGMGNTSEDLVTVALSGIRMLLGLPVGEYYQDRAGQYQAALHGVIEAFGASRVTMLGTGAVTVLVITALFIIALPLWPTWRQRVRTALLWLLCAGCFVAYNFMLVLSYAFIFAERQAVLLLDYNRYIYPYYLGWFLVGMALLCAAVNGCRSGWLWHWLGKAAMMGVGCVFLLLFVRYVRMDVCVLGYDTNAIYGNELLTQAQAQEASSYIERDAAATGASTRTFFVYQGDVGLKWFQYVYEMYPLLVDYSGWDQVWKWVDGKYTGYFGGGGGTFGLPELYNGDAYYHAYTPEEFLQAAQDSGCGYLFVAWQDELFRQSYAPLFSDGLADGSHGAVYRVEANGFVLVDRLEAQI